MIIRTLSPQLLFISLLVRLWVTTLFSITYQVYIASLPISCWGRRHLPVHYNCPAIHYNSSIYKMILEDILTRLPIVICDKIQNCNKYFSKLYYWWTFDHGYCSPPFYGIFPKFIIMQSKGRQLLNVDVCVLYLLYVSVLLKGMSAGHDPFRPTQPFWSAYRTLNYGYSRFHINNSTHVLIEWVSESFF